MTTLGEQTAALLAAAEQDETYAAALREARTAEGERGPESFLAQAGFESLIRRMDSITEMRVTEGKAPAIPRPVMMRDVYDLAVILNNALADEYERGLNNNGE